MIIKKIVTVTLFSSIILMGLLLIMGLFVPASILNKLNRSKKASDTIIAVDANGKPIEGATVQVAPNGATAIVDENGKQVAGATVTATTAPVPTTNTVSATPTTPPPSTTTVASTPAPSPPPSTTTPTAKPAPSISSFSASPASIAYNASSTLTWASANATSCSLSPGGGVATSGTTSTGALIATKTYTLSCSGNGSASKQTTVTVAAAPPPAAPDCGSPGGACTVAQVATHNSASNCWVIYSGSYYVITSYVNNHNGGSGAFTSSTCGHDITAYMNGSSNTGTSVGKHRHSNGAYNTLNSYKVGAVN